MFRNILLAVGVSIPALLASGASSGAETLDCTFTDYHDPMYQEDFLRKIAPPRQRHVVNGTTVQAGKLTGKVTQNSEGRLRWTLDFSNIKAESGTTVHYKFTFMRKTGKVYLHIDLEGDYKPIERIAGTCKSRA